MFPASQFNDRWFLSSIHFPVQLLRMVCAVLAAVAVGNILRIFHREVRGQLEEWASTMEERVRQRTAELENARQEADAANRSKSAFLAAMSHEIRTPMNGVVGMIDLLRQTPLNIDQRQMMTTVRDSAYTLLQIIDEILDFSKIEAGRLTIEQAPISITDVVESVSDMLAPGAAQKSLRLMTFVDPALPDLVQGDVIRLRQILFNLGGNAIKFTAGKADGRVVIRADLAPPGEDGKAWVNFQVSDNGIGMSPETMKRVFKPFTQADASTTRHFGGTGLGLTICDRLAHLMGGRIRLESEPDKGSCFTVSLPFSQAHSKLARSSYDLSGLTILCLTGQEGSQEFVTPYLEHAGANVHMLSHSPSGEVISALDSYEASGNHADIVFVGAGEPLAQRKRLLASMRKHPALAGSHIVAAMRWNEEKEELETSDTVVVKTGPMRRMELLRAMAQAAGRASPDIDIGSVELLGASVTPPSIEDAEMSGELILAVEDNETNREVLRRQLNLLGYAVEIAGNGRIALEQWEHRQYGLVLTDCHMPEMDGFELTRAIREKERTSSRHVPIVAVTANALQGEVERCLECGMDDYLSKPVELILLKRALEKWLPKKNKKAATMPSHNQETKAAPKESDSPLDLGILTKMVGDDPVLHRNLLKQFVAPAKRDIETIHAAMAEHNIGAAAQLAHKLKSAARTIGAHELADICATLELAGKQGDQDQAEALDRRLDEVMAPIEKWIARL
jgi:signal transduction histidine kinase/CheY-like chemotaxis protein/HPt (histidine-containing phosphotransfer) domain-containing protein